MVAALGPVCLHGACRSAQGAPCRGHRPFKRTPRLCSLLFHTPHPTPCPVAQYASLLSPIEPRTKAGARRLAQLAAGHQRFCANQLANKKTSRVLEAAFGPELTQRYMEGLMFDFDPADSPPWFDTSISRMYQHFDREPEPWKDGAKLLSIRQGLDLDKSKVFLERCVRRGWRGRRGCLRGWGSRCGGGCAASKRGHGWA
jgi:hypothetical protein